MWLWNFFLFSNFILSAWFVVIFFLIMKRTVNFYGSREKPKSWITISLGIIFLGLATFTNAAVSYVEPFVAGPELGSVSSYGVFTYLLFEYAAMSSLFYGFLRLLKEPEG